MPSPPHATDAPVEVIYEDEGLLVLSKPAGLTTTAPDNGPCLTRVACDEGDKGIAQRDAKSEYEVRGHAAGVSALHLFPRTGRTHLLRVHCAKAGAPILGDLAYGGPARVVLESGRVITARRPLLHCARVELPRPGLEALDLRAPIHEDLASAWRKLGGPAVLDP